jgi:hypothetical protein
MTASKNKRAVNLELDHWVYDQLVSKILSLNGSVNVNATITQLVKDYLGTAEAPYKADDKVDSLDIDRLSLRARHNLKKDVDYIVVAAFDRKALRESRRRKEVRRLVDARVYSHIRAGKKMKGKPKKRRNKNVN